MPVSQQSQLEIPFLKFRFTVIGENDEPSWDGCSGLECSDQFDAFTFEEAKALYEKEYPLDTVIQMYNHGHRPPPVKKSKKRKKRL